MPSGARGCTVRWLRRQSLILAPCALASMLAFAVPAAARATSMTVQASPGRIVFGRSTRIEGQVAGNPGGDGGLAIELQADPYPFGGFAKAQAGKTAPDGSYRFDASPGRNTRYRVVLAAHPATHSSVARVTVDQAVATRVRYIAPGRVRIVIRTRHPAGLRWGGRPVRWYLSKGSRAGLRRVLGTRSEEPRPQETRLVATIPVPAGRFRFAACFRARSLAAMGAPGMVARCGEHRFKGGKQAPYQGTGMAPFGYPRRGGISRARRYLASRAGVTSFAVVTSQGRLYGSHIHRRFVSASVVKAMLLVAYLRKLHHDHRPLDANSRSLLDPMIHVSDNAAATQVWSIVRDSRLRRLARHAGMTDFSIHGIWANAIISAADQARYFYGMNRLLPREFRRYADRLLSHIIGYESWGIPAVARPRGWRVLFKGGWRGTSRGQLVHQVARLRRRGTTIAMAILTDGDPSMPYGINTIEGVAGRLLHGSP